MTRKQAGEIDADVEQRIHNRDAAVRLSRVTSAGLSDEQGKNLNKQSKSQHTTDLARGPAMVSEEVRHELVGAGEMSVTSQRSHLTSRLILLTRLEEGQ